uniref:Uncharacterized protein n=1 Tax=Oryza meridionalis TaxID=40149 RepID=A0A0E0CMC2_9ORYZ
MASMMGGDFVEAYVLKNAYKEKLRRMEAAEAAAAAGKKDGAVAAAGSAGQKKAAAGGGMFGFMKKKVHPRAAETAPAPAMETSSA